MIESYAYTAQIWPSLLTGLLLVALAAFSWRRRTVPGARVFAVTSLIAVPWVAGATMKVAAVDAAGKLLWFKWQAAWQLPVITTLTCFVLAYAWPGRWLARRNLMLLSLPPLLCMGMAWTDSIHHLSWRGFTFADGLVVPARGPGNMVFLVYGYGLTTLALIVLAWLFARSPRHRWPVALTLAGAAPGRVFYTLDAAHVLPTGLPFNVPPIAAEYAPFAITLFGFRIHTTQLLDSHGRVVTVCFTPTEGIVVLADPDTLEVLAHLRLPPPPGDTLDVRTGRKKSWARWPASTPTSTPVIGSPSALEGRRYGLWLRSAPR